MKNIITLSLILSLSAALTACGGDKEATADKEPQSETTTEASKNPAPTEQPAEAQPKEEEAEMASFFSNTEALQKAEESLKALPQFEGKPLNVFQDVKFYDDDNGKGRILIDIQDPNKPENIDHYEYDAKAGTWSEPQPVQISGDGDMSANLTPLSDIKFTNITEVIVPMWHQKVEEEAIETDAALPTYISMILFVPNQDRFWQTSIDSARASYILRLNLDGSLKSFKKN